MSNESRILPSSFRDPSGFLFEREGGLYRQINRIYKDHYAQLLSGGLYRALTEQGLLVSHDEVDISPPDPQPAYKIIKPRFVPFISYPYEWCFTQLREAALAMLKIQKTAFDFGMSLKDASAFNIQFVDGRPLLELDVQDFYRRDSLELDEPASSFSDPVAAEPCLPRPSSCPEPEIFLHQDSQSPGTKDPPCFPGRTRGQPGIPDPE